MEIDNIKNWGRVGVIIQRVPVEDFLVESESTHIFKDGYFDHCKNIEEIKEAIYEIIPIDMYVEKVFIKLEVEE